MLCLHLLTFGKLSSARLRNVRKHLPALPPLLATPTHLPHLLQAARQSRFASSEESDPTTTASGWQGCAVQSTCSSTPEARSLRLPVSWQAFQAAATCSESCLFGSMSCFCLVLQLPVRRCTNTALSSVPPLACAASPQLCSLLGSGLATPQLGKQGLILTHQPRAFWPEPL